MTCSLKDKGGCTADCFDNGIFKFNSVPDMEIAPDRSVPINDVLYTIAATMNPTTMRHADSLLIAMQLTPPSRDLYKEIRSLTTAPYLEKEKCRCVDEACAEAAGGPISICMDCGHTSARNSQAAALFFFFYF
jgi:hypothetical protein